VLEVQCFGFGKAATAGGYPAIYIVGWVNRVYGIWQSNDEAQTWTQIGIYPIGQLSAIKTISGDPNTYGEVYVGFAAGGYAYLPGTPAAEPVATFSTANLSKSDTTRRRSQRWRRPAAASRPDPGTSMPAMSPSSQ
jgi:hypothetical protein